MQERGKRKEETGKEELRETKKVDGEEGDGRKRRNEKETEK
jgi:hypothetical protein